MIQPKSKVTPFLWFDTQAEDAANFYLSLFADAKIVDVARWGTGSPYPEGSVMSATLELAGQQYILFNRDFPLRSIRVCKLGLEMHG